MLQPPVTNCICPLFVISEFGGRQFALYVIFNLNLYALHNYSRLVCTHCPVFSNQLYIDFKNNVF